MKFVKWVIFIFIAVTVIGCNGNSGSDSVAKGNDPLPQLVNIDSEASQENSGSDEMAIDWSSETDSYPGDDDAADQQTDPFNDEKDIDLPIDSPEYAAVLDFLSAQETGNNNDAEDNTNFNIMNRYALYLSGPSYHPEEQESMRFLGDYLKRFGYTLFSSSEHGFQDLIMKTFNSPGDQTEISRLSYKKSCLLAFALEYYKILSADACIGFLNGRVPDESTVIKMGIAFGTGIPVIHYKYDPRILFPNGINTMISGLTGNFNHVKDIRKLPVAVEEKIINRKGNSIHDIKQRISPYHLTLYTIGAELEDYFTHNAIEFPSKMSLDNLNEMLNYFESNPAFLNLCQSITPSTQTVNNGNGSPYLNEKIAGKVYCSGGLFCPAEVRDMKHISDVLEDDGFSTFLPQRDGGEAFVMEAIDSPLAGSLISKPVENLLNHILFSLDIYEVLKCDYFVINLNGRVPDDGAMAELGVAFGAGKPVVLFKNDIRSLYDDSIHPTLQVVGYLFDTINNHEAIPIALEKTSTFLSSFGDNHYDENLPAHLIKIKDSGKKWQRILNRFKAPVNKMELWNTL